MSKQQPRTFDLSKYKTVTEADSSDGEIKTFDLSNYSPKKKDDTELSGKISSTAGSSEQGGNPRQLFGMSYADWGKKYGAIGEFAADIVDVPIFFKNSIYKGYLQGGIQDEFTRADRAGDKPDYDKLAALRKDINSVSLSRSAQEKLDVTDDPISSVTKTVSDIFLSSLASSAGAGFSKTGLVGAGSGAAIGAGTTSWGGPFAAVGAIGGAIAGFQAATSYSNEFGGAIAQTMEEKGYDMTNPKSIEKAWNDKSLMEAATEKGMARGIPIAAIDLITSGVASKLGKAGLKLAKKTFLKEAETFTEQATKKIVGGIVGATEAVSGSIGEATGQLVSEGKVSDWDAVAMEAIGELGPAAPSIAFNYFKAAQINSTANKENSTKIQSLQTMLESLPENDETAPILQGKITELQRDNQVRNNMVVDALDTAPVPVAKKVLELTNQIESFDQKLQEFDDASKVGSGLTDEQRQQQKTFKDIYTELTTERDNIVGELAKAKEFETNIKAASPEQTMPSPIEVTKIQKAINTMTEFVGENLKAFTSTFAILPNGDYSLSIGKEGKPNAESTVIFNKEERQKRRELDSMLDEGTVTPEEHTNKVADLNKQIIARGIQEKTTLITPKGKVEVAPTATEEQPQTEEFVYETAPENKKQWKSDFEVVDNREGKAGLEVNGVDGRWYVKNNVTGKILPATTKSDALGLIDNAPENDFGQGETYTRPVAVTPAVEPTVTSEPTTEQVTPTEINPENIMLSGLNGGYKSIAGNGFDIRSDISVMDKIDAGASFALNIIRNGKKYVVVGLRLKQDVGARTVGRDGYSIAVIEDTGSLPDNTVEVLTNKAVENTSSVYSRITDATIDSFRPLENEAKISKSTTEQVDSTKKVPAPNGESADTIKSTALEVDEKGNEINNESNRKIKIIQSAKKALSTLRSVLPNFDIVIHQDEASYNEVMKEVNGREGSGGNFSYTENEDGSYSGKIDINLNKANSRTVAHEVAHGILLKTFGDNPAVFKDFKNKLSKILKDSTNKELINFTNQYEGDVAYEEYVTELTGILEQQQDNISPTTLQKVASLINTVVSKLTNGKISVFEDVKDTKELVEFMNTISASIREGKEINEANLKTIQESFGVNALGLSGEINIVDSAKSKSSITSAEIKRFPINENTKVQENTPLSDFQGKRVNLMESDRMVGGYIADAEGSPLFKFYGGVYYPMITGKWWASKSEVKARSIAENANKNRDADGYIYSAPMVGSNTQHMSNTDMLAVTVELMKSDLNNKASIVKKQDIIDSLNKAFNRENVKNKKPALKSVLNKTNNITTLFNELEYVLFQENDNILDKNGKQILGVDKKPISKFTFEERITIVQTLLGDPKVKQRRFPSAGSITETAKKFEEPITGKVENIGDMVTVMRTKGELKFAKTKIDDSFYHKSYPAEIYAVDKDGNPAEIEVFVLDGAYSMKEAVPTLSRSSGGEFTWEDYSSRHNTEMLAIAQYNRTAKLSYAAGNIQPVKSKSQAIDSELSKASGTTQVATTVGSYAKAANILKNLNIGGRVLDYGAGLGLGTDAMNGILNGKVKSYEINSERWKGKDKVSYTKSEDIDGKFDGIVSLNVLNVVPKDVRDFIVSDIFNHLSDDGTAVISSRKFSGDIDGAKNFELGDEPKSYIIKRKQDGKIIDVFQKGYDGNELVEYVKGILGDKAVVEKDNSFGAAGVIITKSTSPKSKSQVSTQYNMDEMFDDPDKMFEHLDNQLSDQKTAKQMGFVLKGYRNISEAIADNMITRSLAKAVGSGFIGITKIGNFSFVNINTKDKDGNLVPNKVSLNSVWKDAFGYGENAIRSMFVKAHNSNNVAAKEVQNTLGSFITNLTTTEGFQEARRELFGSKNNSNNLLTRIGDSLNNMIGNDKKALYRVHSLLDPEAFANEPKEGRPESVEDLSFSELRLFNTLRATNDFIHEWHYRNGFLDENTYQKNKGKYFARAYKEIEEKQYADIYDAINKAKAGAEFDIFKKRKDFSEIEDLTLSDPIYITIKRMGTMAHNKAIFDFAEKVANDANYKSYSKLSEVPENNQKYYKKLNGNGNPKRFGDLTNKYVPIEIYEQLYGTQFVSQYMSTINDFATKYDNMFLRQLTKKLKTVGSPLTRAANVISGFSFAMLGGVDPINLLVKKPDARRSLDSYDSWAQELTKAGLLGGQLSGLDIKKAGKKSQGLGVIKSVLGDKAAKAYETVDQLASDTYGKVDDITKIAYYRTLVENYGVSKEDAIKATAKQMQNYNTVTNAFKLAAKLPFIGNAFIKFKPDSMRILYNTFKEKPIFGLMFVAMLTGLSKSFSKLSGESDEEREIRESRPNTTKFKIGNLVDINFGWKIGGTEYNVARYLSPYTMYDKGYRNNLVSDMSEYAPLQVQYLGRGRGIGGYMPKFSDPLLGPVVQALIDVDNSGLKISDPRANNFVGQTLSSKQQWFNRVKYIGRSWGTPYAAWAGNMMDSFNEKQNYKGEINDPLNAMLSIAVKNEKINPDILTEKYGRYLNSMDREVGGIVNDWKSKQKKSLEQIDKIRYDFDNGKIKDVENRDKQIKDIEDEYSDLAIDLQGQMLEIVGDAKDPQEMLIKLQKLKAKKK
jgi:hypothetical protein